MSRARGKRPAAPKRRPRPRGPAVWAIIVVDQVPLRRRAAADCRREMTRLERARADWKRFEQEDRPAFERWRALALGPLLTELREINAQIHEKEMLVEEVEAELFIGNWPSYEAAYQAVRRRREQPPAPPPGASTSGSGASGDPFSSAEGEPNAEGYSQFEEELLFEDFVRAFMGMDPDRLSDSAYRRMFAEFKKNVLGGGAAREARGEHGNPGTAKASPPGEQASRLKELYRILVRRLHPDTRADVDAQVSALWHEVQQAYSDGNVERLEMLLAFTDVQAESTGEHTSVGQMRAVLREVRRSLNALLRTLAGARREMAWNFAQNTNRTPLEQKLRRQMERDISARRGQLTELESFIESWSAPKRKRRSKRRPEGHAEFPF